MIDPITQIIIEKQQVVHEGVTTELIKCKAIIGNKLRHWEKKLLGAIAGFTVGAVAADVFIIPAAVAGSIVGRRLPDLFAKSGKLYKMAAAKCEIRVYEKYLKIELDPKRKEKYRKKLKTVKELYKIHRDIILKLIAYKKSQRWNHAVKYLKKHFDEIERM